MAKYTRNASLINSKLFVKDNKMFTKEDMKIQVPVRYLTRNMLRIDDKVTCLGIFAIIDSDLNYAVMNVITGINLLPSGIVRTIIDDVEYIELLFGAGEVIITNLDVFISDEHIYTVFDEFLLKAKIPWYMDYGDIANIFLTALDFTGTHVNKSPEILELTAAATARSAKDINEPYRWTARTGVSGDKISVSLSDMFNSIGNTTNKLSGAYFDKGIISSLVKPTTVVENVEFLLRQ